MSINVGSQDILEAVAYLRCFHDLDDEGIQGFEHVDPRQLNLVLAGLVLSLVKANGSEPEVYLDHLTRSVRRRFGTDADGISDE